MLLFFFLGRGFLGFFHWFGRHRSEVKIAQRRRYLRFRRFVQIQMKDSPDIVLEKDGLPEYNVSE